MIVGFVLIWIYYILWWVGSKFIYILMGDIWMLNIVGNYKYKISLYVILVGVYWV